MNGCCTPQPRSFKRKSCLCFCPTEISQLYDFNTAVLQLWDLRQNNDLKN